MPRPIGIIASSGGSSLTLTYRGSLSAAGNLSSSGFSIGAAADDRLVIVCAGGFLQSGNNALFSANSITINGANPTKVAGYSSLTRYPSGLFSMLVASGTTVDIATSLLSPNSVAGTVYTLTGYQSSTAFGSGSDAGSSFSPSISPTGRAAIIALANEFGSGTFSWTNITADFNDGSVNTNHAFSSAGALITSAPSISCSSGASNTSYAWAGWQ